MKNWPILAEKVGRNYPFFDNGLKMTFWQVNLTHKCDGYIKLEWLHNNHNHNNNGQNWWDFINHSKKTARSGGLA